MMYFLETSGTIPTGLGFEHFDRTHLTWLVIATLIIGANCFLYRGQTHLAVRVGIRSWPCC